MDDLVKVIVVLVFILLPLLSKLRQRTKDEHHEEPPVSENPEIEDLTETLRRMIYGDRPAPPARPASREEQQSEPPGPIVAPHPRPVPAQTFEDEARDFRLPAQVRKPDAEPQAPYPVAKTPPKPQPSRSMPAREREPEPHERVPAFVMFKDLDDVRRAIVLSEILAPPLAFR